MKRTAFIVVVIILIAGVVVLTRFPSPEPISPLPAGLEISFSEDTARPLEDISETEPPPPEPVPVERVESESFSDQGTVAGWVHDTRGRSIAGVSVTVRSQKMFDHGVARACAEGWTTRHTGSA